jgi:hypothetical protein
LGERGRESKINFEFIALSGNEKRGKKNKWEGGRILMNWRQLGSWRFVALFLDLRLEGEEQG